MVTLTSTGVPFDADDGLRGAGAAIDNALRCCDCGQTRGWGLQR